MHEGPVRYVPTESLENLAEALIKHVKESQKVEKQAQRALCCIEQGEE